MRLIDADALKKIWCDDCENKHLCEVGIPACYDVQQVDALPTIEAEPIKHGRWIEVSDGSGYVGEPCEACSVCGMQTDYPSNFCPDCGAKMDEKTLTEAALEIADSVMMGD